MNILFRKTVLNRFLICSKEKENKHLGVTTDNILMCFSSLYLLFGKAEVVIYMDF